jgi:hypothetical protein
MTPSEEILARYKETKKGADALGRVITVRRLRPSQKIAVMRMADSDKPEIYVPLLVAASVSQINEDMLTFPRSNGELNSVLDRLDQEGLAAAQDAFVALSAPADEPEPEAEE